MLPRSIGNDIVDLDERRGDLHPRFVQRVFATAEHASVAKSPARMWLHWAAKEAAFKALSRLDPQTVFSPVRFEYDYANRCVEYGAHRLPCRCTVMAHYVSVVCATDKAMFRGDRLRSWVSTITAQVPSTCFSGRVSPELSQESRAVRDLALGNIASLTGIDRDALEVGTLEEARAPQGALGTAVPRKRSIPCLKVSGRFSKDLLSFSHDGRYVMCTHYPIPSEARQARGTSP